VKKFPQNFPQIFRPLPQNPQRLQNRSKQGANVRSREIFSKKFFPKIFEDDEDDEDALNLRL